MHTAVPFVVAYLVSCAVSALIASYCWVRADVVGARAYALVALSQSLSILGYVFEVIAPDMSGKIFWDNAQFVTLMCWIGAFLAFTLRYSDRRLPHPRVTAPLIAAPLVALVALAYTDPLHGLIRGHPHLVRGEPYDALIYSLSGPVWALSIYCYGAYLSCVLILLLNPARSNPHYRSQTGLLVLGSLIPVAGTVLSLSVLADNPDRDISPFTYAISSILVAWALFRFRLFDLVPIARDMVVESMTDAVFVLDCHGRLIDQNAAARLLVAQLAEDQPRLDGLLQRWWERHPNASAPAESFEEALQIAGELRQFDVRAEPIVSRRGVARGCLMVVRDVTERMAFAAELQAYRDHLEALVVERTANLVAANARLEQEIAHRQQLEAQIISGQRLEALGRMASGIVHDVNNVLGVVRMASDMLMAGRAPDHPDMPELVAIRQATTQAAQLTRQLLAFSRGQALELVPVDLATVVSESAAIVRHLAGPAVELRLDLHAGRTMVFADVAQLQQVLVNLVVNARDAMPDGGALAISVCSHDPAPGRGERDSRGPTVRLTVRDTGQGMDSLTQQRLFEPFFTTKRPGDGTGLGLAVVYGIVSQLGGTIAVASTLGQGSTFTIDLPPLDAVSRPTALDRSMARDRASSS